MPALGTRNGHVELIDVGGHRERLGRTAIAIRIGDGGARRNRRDCARTRRHGDQRYGGENSGENSRNNT